MRVKQAVACGAVVAGLMSAAGELQAHHAFAAEFDANRPIQVKGVVTKVEWTNPHTWFHLDVKTADGTVERWLFEGGGPSALIRRGFTKDSVKIGTELSIQGYMAKGTPRRANARMMTDSAGQELFVGSSGTGEPVDGFGK